MATIYAKVCEEDRLKFFDQIEWHPWINVKDKDRDLMPQMILHKYLRERGVFTDERFTVDVFIYDDDTPLHQNGRPTQCQRTTFEVGKR